MTLHETARAANIVGSIQQYFTNELATVLNSSQAAIDYGGGLDFADAPLPEWIQVRAMAAVRPMGLLGPYAGRAGDAGEPDARGQELYWILNVNCFVRPAKLTALSNLRPWVLRDLVLDKLLPGKTIPVKDYQGQSETIGYLFIDALMEDRPIHDPERTDLLQHNLVFALRWTEVWVA